MQTRVRKNRLNYSWRDNNKQLQKNRCKAEDKTPIAPTFTVKGGVKIDLPDDFNELDIFRCYITDQLVKYITE